MAKKAERNYSLSGVSSGGEIAAPALAYQPRDPQTYQPNIGLIACGGITKHHLRAYRAAGYRVIALCDIIPERARKRKTEFYPDAKVYRDYRDLLKRDDIEVVDIATHPPERAAIIEDCACGRQARAQPEAVRLGPRFRPADGRSGRPPRLAAGRQPERPLGAPLQLHSRGDPRGPVGRGDGRPSRRSTGTTAGSPAPSSRRSST